MSWSRMYSLHCIKRLASCRITSVLTWMVPIMISFFSDSSAPMALRKPLCVGGGVAGPRPATPPPTHNQSEPLQVTTKIFSGLDNTSCRCTPIVIHLIIAITTLPLPVVFELVRYILDLRLKLILDLVVELDKHSPKLTQ